VFDDLYLVDLVVKALVLC